MFDFKFPQLLFKAKSDLVNIKKTYTYHRFHFMTEHPYS
jgi:hypothetical protein